MTIITLQFLGFCLVVMYIVIAFDDFIWDVFTLVNGFFSRKTIVALSTLTENPPKLIALTIAAWKEDNVIKDVIENILDSQIYPQSMYHIFIGVYPNDSPTIAEVLELEEKYPNIHVVINYKAGPTTKAQNLNYVFLKVKEFEAEKNWKFSAITVHDSEDIVHPYEFLFTNYLIDTYPALQFPVFPMMKKPTLKNFFKTLTVNTYADEFAENHFITMVNRHKSGAFVPSAGTGFSLSRETIELLGDEVLPVDSLTEDYKLSLTLYEEGIQMYYVMQRLKRVNNSGKIVWDYIATRSIFPSTYKTAVRQKTRWITGITMQSYEMKEIFKNNMSFVGRYSIYKDQKAKIVNLLSPIGYPILIYFIVSLFRPMQAIYPSQSLAWYLGLVVSLIAIERQFMRGLALYNVYGLKTTFYGVFFPPLLPIRIVWGNTINFVSTLKAYQKVRKLKKDQKQKNKAPQIKEAANLTIDKVDKTLVIDKAEKNAKKENATGPKIVKWDKTDHSFVDGRVLQGYRRKLGDALIERDYLSPSQVNSVLRKNLKDMTLGDFLIKQGLVNEDQLIEALSHVNGIQVITDLLLDSYDLSLVSDLIEENFLREFKALPILRRDNTVVIACTYENYEKLESYIDSDSWDIILVLARKTTIENGLYQMFESNTSSPCPYCEKRRDLSLEQIVIIKNYAHLLNQEEEQIASSMGLSV